MSAVTNKQKQNIIDKYIAYIKEHGIRLNDKFYYWNTYPVVIKDVCVSYVAVNGDKVEFGDFPHHEKSYDKWVCIKSQDDMSSLKADRNYLEKTLKSMIITDEKKLQKQW